MFQGFVNERGSNTPLLHCAQERVPETAVLENLEKPLHKTTLPDAIYVLWRKHITEAGQSFAARGRPGTLLGILDYRWVIWVCRRASLELPSGLMSSRVASEAVACASLPGSMMWKALYSVREDSWWYHWSYILEMLERRRLLVNRGRRSNLTRKT